MLEILVDNFIRIPLSELPTPFIADIMSACTYSNPEFLEKIKRNQHVIGIPRFLKTYFIRNNSLLLPRGKIEFLKSKLQEANIQFTVRDGRVTLQFKKQINFRKGLALLSYQEKARNSLVTYTQRLLSSDCGSGKTVIGCGIINALQQQTLIVVDTTELLEQWKDEISKFLTIKRSDIGQIGAGIFDVKPITVALVQSLHLLSSLEWENICYSFGCVIYDEVQGLPAPTRFELITKFPAKYLYGLSATIQRSDTLEFFTYDAISPTIISIDQKELEEANRFLSVDLVFAKFYKFKNLLHEFKHMNWNALIDRLISNKERNAFIANEIETCINNGHKVLVLTSRVEHCNTLVKLLRAKHITAELFIGDVDKEDRQDIKTQIENSDVSCIVATYQIAQKGLNIPSLSCLHLPLPIKDANILKQATGRIRRVYPEKEAPLVVDYVDMSAPILKKKAKNRAQTYLDLGYIKLLNQEDLFVKIPRKF